MDTNALVQQLMAEQEGEMYNNGVKYDASHPLWDLGVREFIERYGREPATDSDMEGDMQEILTEIEAQHNNMNASADRQQKALINNLPAQERVHALDRDVDIPEEVWSHAEDIYIDQYGEEDFGGDASMEKVHDIALSLMGTPRRDVTADGGVEQSIIQKMLGGMGEVQGGTTDMMTPEQKAIYRGMSEEDFRDLVNRRGKYSR